MGEGLRKELRGLLQKERFFGKCLLVLLLLVCLCSGCSQVEDSEQSGEIQNATDQEMTSTEYDGPYYGRDCLQYDSCLYWNNGIWFSEDEGNPNRLPEDVAEIGMVTRTVDAMPQADGEAAILPVGTKLLYAESANAVYAQQNGGYVQYIPMEGMEAWVKEMQAIQPTGEIPGYEYGGTPYIFYEGKLYGPWTVYYEKEPLGELRQIGHILCRCDQVPTEHLHSSSLDAGTELYVAETYPDCLVVLSETGGIYQLYTARDTVME